ncbi:MAG: tetratricopeptide repeat protein [Magnetococcales bacterium]|nr:tetratricopeptide repeat protein [Magnetococcales bacterium]
MKNRVFQFGHYPSDDGHDPDPMSSRYHTLLLSGWIVLLIGLMGIFLPTILSYATGVPGNPALSPALFSSMVVTAIGGAISLLAIVLRHNPSQAPHTSNTSDMANDMHRCDAIFQWQRSLDPGDDISVSAIMNIPNNAVRSLAGKLYQKPGVTFRLQNISRIQADQYSRQLAECGIACSLEAASHNPQTPLNQLQRMIAFIPGNPYRFLIPVTALALSGISWPFLLSSQDPRHPTANYQLEPHHPSRLISSSEPVISSLRKLGRPVEQQRLITNLALLDLPFQEVGQTRDQAIKALNSNNLEEAEKQLVQAFTIISKENDILPIKDKNLSSNAADLLGSLGDLQLMQSKPTHAARYYSQAALITPFPDQRAVLLQQQGDALYQAGDFPSAETTLLESVNIAKTEMGPKHPQVTTSLASLGLFYEVQGLHEKAEPVFRETLALQQELFGVDNLRSAETLENLSAVLANQNRLEEALVLEKQALRIKETVLGPNDPGLVVNLDTIADIYLKDGHLDEADQIQQRAMEIQTTPSKSPQKPEQPENTTQPVTVPSPTPESTSHPPQPVAPSTPPAVPEPSPPEKTSSNDATPEASSLNGLASRYYSAGDYEQALVLFQRSLDQNMETLGENHPAVATVMNNLASILASLGRYEEAVPLFEKSLRIKQETLPANNMSIATSMKNLATIYSSQNRFQDAEKLQQETLKIVQANLGMTHPEVGSSLNNLARTYDQEGRYAEAEPLYLRSMEIFARTYPENKVHMSVIMQNYANLLRKMNRPFDAAKIEAQARKFMDNP